MKLGICTYCGAADGARDDSGGERIYVCDAPDCGVEHEADQREYHRVAEAEAREAAEMDDYERYR